MFTTAPRGFGAEVDAISPVPQQLQDSRQLINQLINARLQEGVDKANIRQKNAGLFLPTSQCNENILYTELRSAIFQSLTASLGLKGYSLDKQLRELLAERSYTIELENSIYQDITYFEGMSLNLKELSALANVSGFRIGLDKIGHFFSEGYQYFSKVHEDNQTLAEALAWGRQKEEGLYGFKTTGIFSYADLVANFNGYRFWNRILLKERDPLDDYFTNLFTKSYIKCELQMIESLSKWQLIRRWRLQKSFDIADYVDGMWDERNNCNSYASPEIEQKVAARIKQIAPDFTCPATVQDCRLAGKKYQNYAPNLLHPQCLQTAD